MSNSDSISAASRTDIVETQVQPLPATERGSR